MNKSAIVFGAGAFGSSVAKSLYEEGVEVMIVDKNEELIQNIANYVTNSVIGDISEKGVIDEIGLNNFDVAIVSIGDNLAASIIAAVESLDAGIKTVYAKARNEMQSKILTRLGVHHVIYPEMAIGERLGKSIAGSNLIEYIHFSDNYSIIEISPAENWVGHSIRDLDVRRKYNVNIIAYLRADTLKVSPDPDDIIHRGDRLLVVGEDEDLNKLNEI